MAVLILAGCGGRGQSKVEWRAVDGGAFHFRAPASWQVAVAKGGATAKDGSDFVQVATFPLARAYTDVLFRQVQGELSRRMADAAGRAGGRVSGHTVVTVDGRKSHSYDVRVGDRTDRYTFVLRGKREFLLVCSAAPAVCRELAASFAAG